MVGSDRSGRRFSAVEGEPRAVQGMLRLSASRRNLSASKSEAKRKAMVSESAVTRTSTGSTLSRESTAAGQGYGVDLTINFIY